MGVDLALFRGDELLGRGSIVIDRARGLSEFSLEGGGLLVISHEFGLPACSLGLRFRGSVESERLLEASLAMGVHDFDDWESVALGADHTLGFFCRAITTLPGAR
jgi:hypothetical protein